MVLVIGVECSYHPHAFRRPLESHAQVTTTLGSCNQLVVLKLLAPTHTPDVAPRICKRLFNLFGFNSVSKNLS